MILKLKRDIKHTFWVFALCAGGLTDSVNAANVLVFTTQPSETVAGSGIAPFVTVSVQDGLGHTVASANNSITLSIGSNPVGGTLSGTLTMTAVNGVATFSTLSIDKSGLRYTLTANTSGLPGISSTLFDVISGAAHHLSFLVQPTDSISGSMILPAVRIGILDALGNLVTNSSILISVGIGANPGSAVLTGTLQIASVNGVAIFSDIRLDKVGFDYTLVATTSGLGGASSNPFDITHKLVFTIQPTAAIAGASLSPSVQVTLVDGLGNTVSASDIQITLAIAPNPPAGGGILAGTKTVLAVNGIAIFSNLSINRAGSGYKLLATATGVVSATSSAFDINHGAADKFIFDVQPVTTLAGAIITPAVVVKVLDRFDNTVFSYNSSVSLSIGNNPSAGTLSGSLNVAASSGVAKFSNLRIDKGGIGYDLNASASGIATKTSNLFNIIYKLVFINQPSNTVASTSISPALTVEVHDASDVLITTVSASITISIGTNPGGGTPTGTLTMNTVNGTAAFDNIKINKTGSGYTLMAVSGIMTAGISRPFNILPGLPAKLAFSVSPGNTILAAATFFGVKVSICDIDDNACPTTTNNVTLSIGVNAGPGVLSGTLTVAAINGIATFNSLVISKPGLGYTLLANSTGLSTGTSTAFNVHYKLAYFLQPSNSTDCLGLVTVKVVIQDALNATVTNATDLITVALASNPSAAQLTLQGVSPVQVNAVNGIATFTNMSINKSGSGYTLSASAVNQLGSCISTSFLVTGCVFELKFIQQPSPTLANLPFNPVIKVGIFDSGSILVTSAKASITLYISNNANLATFAGAQTVTVNTVNGVATFFGLSMDKAGANYQLFASDNGDNIDVLSNAFNIMYKLDFSEQPTVTVAGATINASKAVKVTVLDGLNQVVDTSLGITIGISTNPGGGVLSGTTTRLSAAGVVTFDDLSINKTGVGYRLSAIVGILVNTIGSGTFNIVSGPPEKVGFSVQPTNTTAKGSITPAIKVEVQDALGNRVTNAVLQVTLSIANNAGGGALFGNTARTSSGGVAIFSNINIDRTGVGYTLQADAPGLAPAISTAFNITYRMVFTLQPSNTVAGNAIDPAVQVSLLDAGGNIVTSATNNITVSIGVNPGGGTLSGTTTVAAVGGIATFSDLSINRTGIGYKFNVFAADFITVQSAPFDILAAAPNRLSFSIQPANTEAGVNFVPAPQVQVQDAFGNLITTATDFITLDIGSNPGAGTLSGTISTAAVNGVAVFKGISINKSGTAYTLQASALNLSTGTCGGFNITAGVPKQLGFIVQPANAVALASIAPAVKVAVLDALGNLVPSSTNSISITISANPGSATLSGASTEMASGGIATFSNLSIDKIGVGYSLLASTSGAITATSSNLFDISYRLVFTVQPSNSTAGVTIAPAVTVTLEDGGNATITSFSGEVTLAMSANPGGGTLAGTVVVNASAGVAVFNSLSINKTGTSYSLAASASGMIGTTSGNFNISPSSPAGLVFSSQPASTVANMILSPSIMVTVIDSFGNVVPGNPQSTVTISIGTNPGGGVLSGSTIVNTFSGVATFNNLRIDKAGNGYTLVANVPSLSSGTSDAFNLSYKLTFSPQPVSSTAGQAMTPSVLVQDGQGNTITTANDNITVSIGNNPSGGTLSGVVTHSASNGIAAFTDLSIEKAGTNYTLTAAASGLFTGTSAAFNINPGSASKLAVIVQPGPVLARASIAPGVKIVIQDIFSNTVTSAANPITMAIETNPSAAVLSGMLTVNAVGGIATFSDLSINKAGVGFTLMSTSPGLTPVSSSPFDVRYRLVFTSQPVSTAIGLSLPVVEVAIQDALGFTITTATDPITLAFGANPGGGNLLGTFTLNASSGVASFSTLGINKIGLGYTLTSAASGMYGATSTPFNITYKLVFIVHPSAVAAQAAITPVVKVAIQDGLNNTITSETRLVTMDIGVDAGSGTLLGATTVAAINGVATFSNLRIDNAGVGYTLKASAQGLLSGSSNPFTVQNLLVFKIQPVNTSAGNNITPTVEVDIVDALGNTVSGAVDDILIAIGSNPGSDTLSGSLNQTAVNGVALFSNLSLDKAASGYTLVASAVGLGSATSTIFNIVPAAPAKVEYSVQPTNSVAGETIAPVVKVAIKDVFNNIVSVATNTVTLNISTGPENAILTGNISGTPVAGIVSFSNLRLNKAFSGYKLSATASGLTNTDSASFNILASLATHIAFTTQPSVAIAGATISPAVNISILDAFDNIVPSANNSVALMISTNPGSASLFGTTTVSAVSGVATFNNLSINKTGAAYTLGAISSGLASDTSAPFDITPGAPTQLGFTVQPTLTTANAIFSPSVEVSILDAFGNIVTDASNTVSVGIATNAGSGVLSGALSMAATGGVASFSNLYINNVGKGYSLSASASGLLGATSSSFDIAYQLNFIVQPVAAIAGVSISPAIMVSVQDSLGAIITSATNSISLTLGANPGGATLSGTLTSPAVTGIATFSGLMLDKVSSGYTLVAHASGLVDGVSTAFIITEGAPAKLIVSTQPGNAQAGATLPLVQVSVLDAFDNLATSSTVDVTLSIGSNQNQATLSGTITANAVGGKASFDKLSIIKAGTGYTLSAASSGLSSASSLAFNITAGAAAKLAFQAQPTTGQSGMPLTPVQVIVQDTFGNPTTNSLINVLLSLGVGSPGGSLSGMMTSSTLNGVASFTSVTIDKIGGNYVLIASATGLLEASSAAFDVLPGAPAGLAFIAHPLDSSPRQSIGLIKVSVLDAAGNLVTSASNEISIALLSTPTIGTLSGISSVAADAGIATFSGNSVDKIGDAYTLMATATGLSSTTSSVFKIVDTSPPLIVSELAAIPASPKPGENVSFSVGAEDDQFMIYSWTVTDGTIAFSLEPTFKHTFKNAGSYSVAVTIRDLGGLTSTSTLVISVSDSSAPPPPPPIQPPVITSLPVVNASNATVGALLTFSVGATDPNDRPLIYIWSFGDGSTGSGSSVEHAFSVAGTYQVTVSISNNIGATVSSGISVVIVDKNSGGGGGATPPIPMSVSKMQGKLHFDASGRDSCYLMGVIPNVPAGFDPVNATVVVDVGGAKINFVLNSKAQAKNAHGSIQLKLKPSVKDKISHKSTFLGGKVAFVVKLTKGSWSSDWSDEGVNPAINRVNLSIDFDINVNLGGTAYSTMVTTHYSSKAGKSGMFKK